MNPLDVNKDPQAVLNENMNSKMTETAVTEIMPDDTESFPSADQTIVEHEIEADHVATDLKELDHHQKNIENTENQSNNDNFTPSTLDDQPADFLLTEQRADESVEAVKTHHNEYASLSKKELIETLQSLIEQEVDQVKDQIESIKQLYYKKIKVEIEELKKAYAEANEGDEDEFIAPKDENEELFKSLLNQFRLKKASVQAKIEKEKESNLIAKQQLLDQMKTLVESKEDVSSHIVEFRNLQQKWKSIGQVPATASTELWKHYNHFQEEFWDLIKINNELREYDFKKNLEIKNQLCDAAEKLVNEVDIISAFQQLQKLHEDWHETGPVSRELREEVWTRFKDSSAKINKKHQAHFDSIRKIEEDNFVLKTQLCEKIEAFDYSDFKTYKAWDEGVKTILAWQEEWRTIGFAPRKVNQKIFDRYRKACDAFFTAKTQFYKETKSLLAQNAEKKKILCEQAEALKDSIEWKDSGDKLIQLQKEWKTIGPVPKKISDELWKRFIAACDFFFEQKNKNLKGLRGSEADNLAKKKELINRISTFEKSDNNNESIANLKALMSEWNEIGHVPFKEKDKIYKDYREALDKQFDLLNVDASVRRLDSFKSNLKDMSTKGENKLYHEREKLVRAYEHLKSEIATYENNIGFFSSHSKKGGGLIKEMERKIETLKDECKLIEQKINLIDENM